jgi:hypothetical protein
MRKEYLALYVKVMRFWGRHSTTCSNIDFKNIELVVSIEEQEMIRPVQRMLLVMCHHSQMWRVLDFFKERLSQRILLVHVTPAGT